MTVEASQLSTGTHTISALYSGDSVFSGSSGSTTVTVNLNNTASAIVPAISTGLAIPQGGGKFQIHYTIKLTNASPVATTLTDFTENGVSHAAMIRADFGTASIPGLGSITANLPEDGQTLPETIVFGFTGMDANGGTWTQQIPVLFTGPQIGPVLSLTIPASTTSQNPSADPSCQWPLQLNLQENDGFHVLLAGLATGKADYSKQISQIFGTNQLAPYGVLQGTLCQSGIAPPQALAVALTGLTESGSLVAATAAATLQGPAQSNGTLSVSPAMVSIPPSGSANLQLNVPAGVQWTASIFPSNLATSWLTVSALSGTGPASLALTASSAGLQNGVYNAFLVIQAPNATPAYLAVPIVFVVGGSSGTNITKVENAASFNQTFAPGMIMGVFGTQLAPNPPVLNGKLPLPLNMGGASATVNGVPAPLYYTSDGQLNIQIPYETGAGIAVLGLNNNGQVSSFTFPVTTTAPGIFMTNDGMLNPNTTAKQGQITFMYITGEGDVSPRLITGATPPSGTSAVNLPQPIQPVSITVGGVPANIVFIGIPSGLAGATQINFQVPQNAPTGMQPVVVTVGGVASAPVNLNVTQ